MAEPAPVRTKHELAGSLALFAVALGFRVLHVVTVERSVLGDLLLGDARGYDAWAQRIAAGDWLGSEVYYQAPLYPHFLATVYTIFGHSLECVRWIQAIGGALACVLLAGAASRFFSPRAGTLAGVLLAVYPPAIFFDTRVDKASLELLLLCLALWLLARQIDQPPPGFAAATGCALGLLCLSRENAITVLVVVFLWTLWRTRRFGRRALPAAGLFLAGAAMVLIPVTLRNLAVGGELHLTTSQLGPNFFIGNNPAANGTYAPLRYGRETSFDERDDATALAEKALGRKLDPAEVSSYWLSRALAYIREHPLDWLGRKGRTLLLVGNAVEVADAEDLYTHLDLSPLLRVIGFVLHFGIVAPLACFGAWVSWDRRRAWMPLVLILAAYAASLAAFYVFARYRLPLVPILLPFAAAGIVEGWAWLRGASRRRAAGAAVTALAVAVLCNWPTLPRDSMRSVTRLNVGIALLDRGDTARAVDELRCALELDPTYALAHYTLGNALKAAGDLEGAMFHYGSAVTLEPLHVEAHNNWGTALAALGRVDEAIERFRLAIAVDPSFAVAHANLGHALRSKGFLDQALAHYEAAARIDPAYEPARIEAQSLRGRVP